MWGIDTLSTAIPLDYGIIFLVFVLFAWDAFRAGVGRVSALSLALAVALLLAPSLTQTYFLSGMLEPFANSQWFGMVSFAGLGLLLYLGMRYITDDGDYGGKFLQAVFGAAGATIMLLVVWQQLVSSDRIWDFGPQIDTLFAAPFILWWVIGALLLLAIARR